MMPECIKLLDRIRLILQVIFKVLFKALAKQTPGLFGAIG